LIESFAQLEANMIRDLLAISTDKYHRVVVQRISEVSSHTVRTVAFGDPFDLEGFGCWPVQIFPPRRICNTGFAGQTLHPCIALESVAVIGGEDEYDMCAVPESIDKEIFIFGLRAPRALALCRLDVLVVPTFNQKVSNILDPQIDA